MTIQHHRVNLSIASPAEIERTAQQLAGIREDFLNADGNLALWTPRLLIFNSWQRCRTLHVNPSQRYAPLAIARETQLDQLYDDNALLIQAAHPVMKHLVDVLADSGYVIVLSDTQGRLLEIMGDVAIRRRLAHIDFVAGGDWSEAAAGTNAIGTALADKHVVQLLGAEHYCDGWQDLTCTAAPIRHPYKDEIVGTLDVTGNYRLIRPFLTSFLATAALEIEQQLHMLFLSHNYSELQQNRTPSPTEPSIETPSITHMSNASPHKPRRSVTSHTPLHLSVQEQRVHDAERLTAACSIVSASLDLQLTLENVVIQTAYLLKIEGVGVHIFNAEDEMSSVYFAQPVPLKDAPDILVIHLKQTDAITLIHERGEPVLIDDVLTSDLFQTSCIKQTGIRALALLPLVSPRGVNGFISVSKPVAHSWRIEAIRLGIAFAAQAAIAIENARLFEVLQHHNRQNEVEMLRETDRLKSSFLAAVSHDLRSPLTAIHASVESLLDDEGVQSVVGKNRLLQNIAGQAHRLGQLVDQLLDLSRIEAGVLPLDRDWTDISALLDDTVKDFERLHNDCTIQRSFDTTLPLYYIDPDRLIQVVWNLLENAFKYTAHTAPIHIHACLLEQEIRISVRDYGPGIPEGEHEKIFQRFYRLAKDQQAHTQGSGLGLAICRGIVEAHKGRIWVEDHNDGGCIFSIALPLSMADPIEYDSLEVLS
ncbi:MAG TPA: ATP-binding protein [Ktedonobacteraceae bacterium]